MENTLEKTNPAINNPKSSQGYPSVKTQARGCRKINDEQLDEHYQNLIRPIKHAGNKIKYKPKLT